MNGIDMKEIEAINKRVAELREARIRQEIEVKTAREQCEAGIRQYQEKYGVLLTAETIQTEYDTVEAELIKQTAELKEQIRRIESGEYRGAQETTTAPETGVTVVGTNGEVLNNPVSAPEYVNTAAVNVPNAQTNSAVSAPASVETVVAESPVVTQPLANGATPPVTGFVPQTAIGVGGTETVAVQASQGVIAGNAQTFVPVENVTPVQTPASPVQGFQGFGVAPTTDVASQPVQGAATAAVGVDPTAFGFGVPGVQPAVQGQTAGVAQQGVAPTEAQQQSVTPPTGFAFPQNMEEANQQMAAILQGNQG